NGFANGEAEAKYSEWEQRHSDLVNRATLIVAKQRHGSTGNIPLQFQSEITKFSDLAESSRGYDDFE
ncbi:MAG TPA: DnaB-like helicase C-terminal domain-containing protein, partial [Sphingomonadaceae bacterium]|nr:DnaB-like helicase C-terminal domain-containing protein [Sphingomonadaceae bacterium]